MILRGLAPAGKRLLTPELASGELARWSEAQYAPFVVDLDRAPRLEAFDAAVDAILRARERFDAELDGRFAPALHRALPLGRRQAADPAPWRYLAVVHRPDFVRHRWQNRSWASVQSRFWQNGTRPDSNAFARLWWIAELTRDGDDYALTEAVLLRQHLATALFVRTLGSYRPLVAACVEVLEGATSVQAEATIKLLHKTLGTVVLEALSLADLKLLVAELLEHASR